MRSSEFQLRLANRYSARVLRWLPDSDRPTAIVQVIHGMAEHCGRYARLPETLTAAGFAVQAHDLPGHGPLAADRGHFADRRGWRVACASIRDVQKLGERDLPGLPTFLLGHSMGSFLLQYYMADFGTTFDGAILSATDGPIGPIRPVLETLLRIEARYKGLRHPSAVGDAVTFRQYNRRFKPNRTEFDWLSRDPDEVDRYVADPNCGFRCTTASWLEVAWALGRVAEPARLARVPGAMSVLMIAGSADPVAKGGKGPFALADCYRLAGLQDVSVRIYPDARHELFNETCREEVTANVIEWLGNHLRVRRSHLRD